jgi:hypothetical protein
MGDYLVGQPSSLLTILREKTDSDNDRLYVNIVHSL